MATHIAAMHAAMRAMRASRWLVGLVGRNSISGPVTAWYPAGRARQSRDGPLIRAYDSGPRRSLGQQTQGNVGGPGRDRTMGRARDPVGCSRSDPTLPDG